MVDLLKHNLEAFQEINKMIDSGIKKIAVPRADRRIEKPYSFMPPLLTKAEFTRLLAGRKTSFFVSINTSRPSFYL